jgi:SHS2 domain-containing protein
MSAGRRTSCPPNPEDKTNTQPAGYQEIEHTADWELAVWAPDLPGLLEQAARGIYALAGMRLNPALPARRTLELQADDAESLLVSFLGELLHWVEQDNLAFDQFQIELDGLKLRAALVGAQVGEWEKEIKAVTYHNLQVRQSARGLQVNIVFDV